MHLSRRCTPGGNSRRSATKISRTCNKDPCSRPLRLVCHSFTSCIYLTIQGKDGIRSSLSDTCTKRSRGEPYNFIGPIRGRFIHSTGAQTSLQRRYVRSLVKILSSMLRELRTSHVVSFDSHIWTRGGSSSAFSVPWLDRRVEFQLCFLTDSFGTRCFEER